MPEAKFAFEPGGAQRLVIAWSGLWKDIRVLLDGRAVATPSKAELEAGLRIPLDDASALLVELKTVGFAPGLRVSRDGVPLPGSAADPKTRIRAASYVFYCVGALSIGLGILAAATDAAVLRNLGLGWASAAAGLLFAVLGWFVGRGSLAALIVGIGLFWIDGIGSLILVGRAGGSPPIGGLVMRAFLTMPMFQAIGAIRNPAPRAPTRRPPPRPTTPAPTAAQLPPTSPAVQQRRLELSGTRAPEASRPSRHGAMTSLRVGQDVAAKQLRFVLGKCVIGEEGLTVTYSTGKSRAVPWAGIANAAVRSLPPDAPWNGQPFLDLIPTGENQPLRLFSTTVVNVAALPGPASTSRLENFRRLLTLIRGHQGALALDAETEAMLAGAPAAPLANLPELAAYDARFG